MTIYSSKKVYPKIVNQFKKLKWKKNDRKKFSIKAKEYLKEN